MAKKISPKQPQEWQKNANLLKSQNVQFWGNGTMRGLIVLDAARDMVCRGTAFIISDQAIGMINVSDGTMNS